MVGGSCITNESPNRQYTRRYKLPIVNVVVSGKSVCGLVDTGCTMSIVRVGLLDGSELEEESKITAFDGTEVKCKGTIDTTILVNNIMVPTKMIVTDNIIDGIDVIIGMDAIEYMGGVWVDGKEVTFGKATCASILNQSKDTIVSKDTYVEKIEDKDFVAEFDGKKWIVKWLWKNDRAPVLRNKIPCYDKGLNGAKKDAYESEIERWIREGILLPWKCDVTEGIIPLMATEQPTKNKVRPVLDFRELNGSIECHTGDDVMDICSDRLREWRQVDGDTSIVDLQSAYLQIEVHEDLWKYQLVRYKNKTYCLTRLGFGLSSAPRIMSKILKWVLDKERSISVATSSYVDDILVNESQTSSTTVVEHLKKYGLIAKPPEPLAGGSALGLKITQDFSGQLIYARGNQIPEIPTMITRRELFSICGKLVGHYPVSGWLRVACSYIKRCAAGHRWEDNAGEIAQRMIAETVERTRYEDPVKGVWNVPKREEAIVWCDASNLALGVLLEIGGVDVEDGAWLRKKDDFNHINVAELDAIMKGVNLAVKWNVQNLTIRTDSATVYSWVQLTITEERKIKTKGASEVIVKRRLGILRNLIDELGLIIQIQFVPSEKNRADALTRVSKSWIESMKNSAKDEVDEKCAASLNLKHSHNQHHMGVDRSLYVARRLDPSVSRNEVKRVVQRCDKCQSIDPAPSKHTQGKLNVKTNWERIAIDVTHYGGVPYLSVVDCGPGRFAIWRALKRETAECIVSVLQEIFRERGPVNEVLMDNATVFRSESFQQMLCKWKILPFFRAAYKASGNGIVERHHRTVKALAERGGIDPCEAVFWYNMTPRSGQAVETIPQRAIYTYEWRHPDKEVSSESKGQPTSITVGDEVWVKPPDARCTSTWKRGVITDINSANNVSVDNMPRHVLDVRRVIDDTEESEEDEVQPPRGELSDSEPRYPRRERHPPQWATDYHM